MHLTGFKSKNAVSKLVARLQEQGVIDKDSKGFLIPKQLFGNIKVLGTVEAGFPSPAEEELIDTMTLDEWLIKNKEATYMLKAKGDSMIEAGIMEGDMILVDRSKEAKERRHRDRPIERRLDDEVSEEKGKYSHAPAGEPEVQAHNSEGRRRTGNRGGRHGRHQEI